jgi:hypothetical protein
MSVIERLEKWKGSHKSHSVQIGIDDSYGATCWEVELRRRSETGKPQRIVASEVQFWKGTPQPWFVVVADEDDDWPGLEATIAAALNAADAGKWGELCSPSSPP